MDSADHHRLTSSLQHLAADGLDAAKVAAAVASSWREIETALTPVIGRRGVGALFERSLYLARTRYPWLAAVPENIEARKDLAALTAVLQQQESAVAAAGGGAHLEALHELLGSLIGQSLAERLLRSTWSNPLTGSAAQDLPHD
ncbi:MAG TPA: hypothetical protein VNS31_01090 [Ramlibacter sp.]|nr:hypothetical protein [Ramlibacter sp.]